MMAEVSNSTSERPVREFSISHVFNAPREQVFKAWTDPQSLAQWWGPKGFGVKVHKLDLKPGGSFLYSIELPGGQKMWGKFVYQEIKAPEHLVFVNSFSDEAEGITRHPFNPAWPLELKNNLTFVEQDGKTTLILQGSPLNATEEEKQAFEAASESMQQGFAGTFEQLDAFLAQEA